MPTPFTHLHIAQRLLNDPQLPENVRTLLSVECSAFLLGSIAADARVSSGVQRANTHFYRYDEPMRDHPWRVMLAEYPALEQVENPAQRAFVAGYVAHLAVDELWTEEMLRAHFIAREWGADSRFRFFMLHILLIYMDERDYAALEPWQAEALAAAKPEGWLPFMDDGDLRAWRSFIAEQVAGESQTLAVLGARVQRSPEEFRAVLDSPERMQADLWAHVSRDVVAQVEARMYAFARAQMTAYLARFAVYP